MSVTSPTPSLVNVNWLPLSPWHFAQYSAYSALPRGSFDLSMRSSGYFGGAAFHSHSSMRSGRSVSGFQSLRRCSESRSSVGGVAPVPNEALRLRSGTELLLPSQCSHMPSRLLWFHTD